LVININGSELDMALGERYKYTFAGDRGQNWALRLQDTSSKGNYSIERLL